MTPVGGSVDLANTEELTDYDIRWPWNRTKRLEPGITTVLRVKNEARSMPWVLPPLFKATQRVVLVDNESNDGTVEVARRVAAECDAANRLTVKGYPFRVSRCGPEHLATPERSIHSLAYFYNWAFSHVQTTYSIKWDGDMVLTPEGVAAIDDLSWQLQAVSAVVTMPRHPVFVESDKVAYVDLGLRNVESYGYPTGPEFPHVKAFEWELRLAPEGIRFIRLPAGLAIELKYLDSDEFAHWTSSDAFAASARTARKRREWDLFAGLNQGRWKEFDGIHRVESPPGVHVIDHITGSWLPAAERPLVRVPTDPRS